jgi:hypothetical protein
MLQCFGDIARTHRARTHPRVCTVELLIYRFCRRQLSPATDIKSINIFYRNFRLLQCHATYIFSNQDFLVYILSDLMWIPDVRVGHEVVVLADDKRYIQSPKLL